MLVIDIFAWAHYEKNKIIKKKGEMWKYLVDFKGP